MLLFKLSIALLAPFAALAVPVRSVGQGKPQTLITIPSQSVPLPPTMQTDLPSSVSHYRRQTADCLSTPAPVGGVLSTVPVPTPIGGVLSVVPNPGVFAEGISLVPNPSPSPEPIPTINCDSFLPSSACDAIFTQLG